MDFCCNHFLTGQFIFTLAVHRRTNGLNIQIFNCIFPKVGPWAAHLWGGEGEGGLAGFNHPLDEDDLPSGGRKFRSGASSSSTPCPCAAAPRPSRLRGSLLGALNPAQSVLARRRGDAHPLLLFNKSNTTARAGLYSEVRNRLHT